MKISVDTEGIMTAIYSDSLAPLVEEGTADIKRVSNVEPCPGGWKAYLNDGTVLGPFKLRQEALDAEVKYLEGELFGKE